jgi:hypothetical protein
MRAHRTLARFATAGAMIVAGLGATLLAPGIANANPTVGAAEAYPPQPPSVTVNHGSVQTGSTVKVAGKGFARGEPVAVHVRYRIIPGSAAFDPPFGGYGTVHANRNGKVMAKVPLQFPGYATITVKGLRSHKKASVTVRVYAWMNPWAGWFRWGGFDAPRGLTAGALGIVPISETTPAGRTADGAQLLAGLLGVTGMLGTGVLTFRRRRA